MRNFIIVILINMFALFIVSGIFNGISITSWQALIVAAIILSLINIYLKPVIKIIMLPVNFFTLGLFTLFINAFLLIIVEKIVKGFYIADFTTAFFGALMLSIIYLIVERFVIVRDQSFYNSSSEPKVHYKESLDKDNIIDVEGKYEDDKNDNV
ncbi:MAG: phage holin family protein [Elusimicrobia bacterium]|nr:phage holin family protein [Elusimicrobiota bacterium]